MFDKIYFVDLKVKIVILFLGGGGGGLLVLLIFLKFNIILYCIFWIRDFKVCFKDFDDVIL